MTKKVTFFAIFAFLICTPFSSASQVKPLTMECLEDVGKFYGIHTHVLLAILMTEGGTLGRYSARNSNGTRDMSLFQVNEIHLRELAQFGITRQQMLNDGCLSAAVAARYLYKVTHDQPAPRNQDEYFRLIARYHSKTVSSDPKRDYNGIYARKLRNNMLKLYKNYGSTK